MTKLKLLLLEDQETDAAIIQRVLSRAGMSFDATLASDREAFISAITTLNFDVILADNYMPQFDALSALQLLNEYKVDTPLILVTGTASEEHAVSMMKAGVSDYILKDRLQRLPNAITGAMEKHALASEQKKHTDRLAKNEALLKEAERLAHIGSWEYDLITGASVWSDEHYRILGYEPGEVIPNIENYINRIHPDDREYVSSCIVNTIEHEDSARYNYRVIKTDGRLSYFEAQLFVTRDKHKVIRLNAIAVDVTGRKTAEEQRLRSEANLRTIFDNTETGYALLNTSFEIISFNQPMYEFSVSQLVSPLAAGGYAVDFFRKERQAVIGSVLNDAAKGITTRYEIPYPQADGTNSWFDVNCHPVLNNEGKVIGIVMSETDITGRKISELREKLMSEDLIQRNNVLEQFAYVISHNLRGPMTTILGIAALLKDKTTSEEDKDFFMNGIEDSVQKLDNVILDLNNVLQYKNTENEPKQLISFSEIMRDVTAGVISPSPGTPFNINTDFSNIGSMTTLKSHMHSIFYNLISNSIKYSNPSVPLVIDIASKKVNDKIILTFKDNGLGMDLSKVEDQVFGLFKRFHPEVAEGKGTGLFMVQTHVKTLGGSISVKSQVGVGTEFLIEI